MTLAYYGKSPKRRMALALGALLAVLIAVAGALALKSALAGTPTSGDKSNVMGATFSSGPTLYNNNPPAAGSSQMFCDGDTANHFTSAVQFTLSAPTQTGAYFIFYLDPNTGAVNGGVDPNVVHQNEVKVYIDGS